ncbi:MAG: hypothetical protein Q4C95_05165 [Planctomycetia bacterium]|nr:hypothetical protein [Planctomycetia bacterium]
MNQLVKIKFNSISAILLILFGVPGIFGEGLHWIFPHSMPALSYENDFNKHKKDCSCSHKNLPGSKFYKFDPNCPICKFCAQSKSQTSRIIILEMGEWIRSFVFISITFHDSLSLLIHTGRSPPLSVC